MDNTFLVKVKVQIVSKKAGPGTRGHVASVRMEDGQPLALPFWALRERDAIEEAEDWLRRRTYGDWAEI